MTAWMWIKDICQVVACLIWILVGIVAIWELRR